MTGFYETIARERAKGPLRAGWVVEGEALGAKALLAWRDGRYVPVVRDDGFPEDGGAKVFWEQIIAQRRLVVCGAGHVALCVIRLARMLGWDVTAIEDRAAFAEKARLAGAGQVLCRPFGEALEDVEGAAFVVMTREHACDVECLRSIMRKPWVYAGAMGSHSRAAQIRRLLLEEGVAPERVEQLRMPIGLPIGARTPEEIAVSTMAELISTVNAVDTGEGFPPGMLEALSEGGGVLAMIVEKHGEAPRQPGTKLLVRPDGSTVGTVGGGYAEGEVLRLAGEMLREGRRESRLVHIDMKSGVMYCGGEVAVLMMPV